jgi:glycosyltransferase involved in cell wall biosynthesis
LHGFCVRKGVSVIGRTTDQRNLPFVSVIMPVRNEADFIDQSLGSVLAQDYPEEQMEILVVDGMSNDGTREKMKSNRVRVLDNPSKIVPGALNIGIRNSIGEVIVRVDGHCVLPTNYISNVIRAFVESGADCVGGVQKACGNGVIGNAVAAAMSSRFGVGSAYFHYGTQPALVDTVYLGSYKREVFSRIGGFDEELVRNQDDEFNFRLQQAGGKIWFDPEIYANYYPRNSILRLWKQYLQYGLFKVLVIRKRRGISSIRQLFPAIFVLSILISIVAALVIGQREIMAVVLGPYVIASFFSALVASKRSIKTVLLLPIVFACMHIAYGVGFLAGLWRWKAFQPNVAAVPGPEDLTYLKP